MAHEYPHTHVSKYNSLLPLSSLLLFLALPNLSLGTPPAQPALSPQFYTATCPGVQSTVAGTVQAAIREDPSVGPALLRLFFHDCFVRGCDASILLKTGARHPSEMQAIPNESVRGHQVIDKVKAELEAQCPATVSCADVIALVAGEVVLQAGGPLVQMRLGRRDGVYSFAHNTRDIPSALANISAQISVFRSRGLTIHDLVALSGAHSIGRSRCSQMENRLNPFDPNVEGRTPMDEQYRLALLKKCGGMNFDRDATLDMDPVTPMKLDNQHFRNILDKRGLFNSDQELLLDTRTRRLVGIYASNQTVFLYQFGVSLQRMSEVGVLTGGRGEVRKQCSISNRLMERARLKEEARARTKKATVPAIPGPK